MEKNPPPIRNSIDRLLQCLEIAHDKSEDAHLSIDLFNLLSQLSVMRRHISKNTLSSTREAAFKIIEEEVNLLLQEYIKSVGR